MITVKNNVFHLATRSLSLVFMIDGAGLAEQLHFGRRLAHPEDDVEALRVKRLSPRPGEVSYSARRMTVCETDLPLEFSAPGRGDMRTPFIIVDPSGDGDEELDLVYQDCETYLGVKRCDSGLVQAIAGEEEAQGIRLDFTDSRRGLTLSLYYTVFPSLDVFVRRTVLTNTKGRTVVRKLCSLQLDLFDSGYALTTAGGPWGRENRITRHSLGAGCHVNASRSGTTGCTSPVIYLEKEEACIATGLLYPGDHCESVEVTPYGKTHILVGVNDETTRVVLEEGESWETPEAFLTFAPTLDEAKERLHRFIQSTIMRGVWKDRLRPISFSTDGALGLDVREDRLAGQIQLAARLGFELFLLGDGWFGVRNTKDDSQGDWSANTLKLPSGLAAVSKACHKEGMLFGIWISPETVSLKSRYAMDHPDWLLRNSDGDSAYEKGLALVDLTNREAWEDMLERLKSLIERTGIDALRWELGAQIFSPHVGATAKPTAWRQEWTVAMQRLQRSLAVAFPRLMISNVTSTSPRFEASLLSSAATLGVNAITDPFECLESIIGADLVVPPAAMATRLCDRRTYMPGRRVSLSTAFDITAFGCLDCSFDLKALGHGGREALARQIAFYKQYREVLQFGRRSVIDNGDYVQLTASSPDRSTILVLLAVRSMRVNGEDIVLKVVDADERSLYRIWPREEGGQSYMIAGDSLKWAGVRLAESWLGGEDEGMEEMGDRSTRLYIIKKEN